MSEWECAICHDEHGDAPRDLGCGLPDEVALLSAEERGRRVRFDEDRCLLDDQRWFVRCVLDLPTPNQVDPSGDARVSLGLWAAVRAGDFDALVSFAGDDNSSERPIYRGVVANEIAGVVGALGLDVIVRPASSRLRPKLQVLSDSHVLGAWQANGIDWNDWMALVAQRSRKWATHVAMERRALRESS